MIRSLLTLSLLVPLPALADSFTVPSQATDAVIYAPVGAWVTHEVRLDLPPGRHEIILPDIPAGIDLSALRISADALVLGAARVRTDLAPPNPRPESAEVRAARADIAGLEAQIQNVRDRADRQALARRAADARTSFLAGLGDSDALPTDADSLRVLADMIAEEVLKAEERALDADIAARAIRAELASLEDALSRARATLAALLPEPGKTGQVVLDVAATDTLEQTPLRLSFFSNAVGWEPAYTLRLTDEDEARLHIERGARISQATGENWEGIALTLSTQRPSDQLAPSVLWPDLRRIFDPEDMPRFSEAPAAAITAEAGVRMRADAAVPLVQEGRAGLSFTYSLTQPASLATGADNVIIPIDEITLDAEIVARAIPFLDDRAYLVAKVTNTSDQPLLAARDVLHVFGTALVGRQPLPAIDPGAETEIAFGPIDGLALERVVLNRQEGDRGVINRANEQTETIRMTVKNLTDRTWTVELRDRVPFSEQEDLNITYTADPAPDLRSVGTQRGILQWDLELAPGDQATVETGYRIVWPDGMLLR